MDGDKGGTVAVIITHVWVARSLLGLSPSRGCGPFLLGEVLKEFQYAITGSTMYKVDFGRVLGVHAIAKENCQPAAKGDVLGASTVITEGGRNKTNVLPHQDSTFTLNFPPYLEDVVDDSDEEESNPD